MRSGAPSILAPVDWDEFDPHRLFELIRDRGPAADAERTVFAFEQALASARIDPELLDSLLVATACLLARARDETPRTVLDDAFRRAVGDAEWRERYAPLLG